MWYYDIASVQLLIIEYILGGFNMSKSTITPDEFVEKHTRRTKAALEDMRRGVAAVTEAPGVKAAAKADKMRTNLVAALDSGKWARRVASVSVDDWKNAMLNKGVNRVAAGLDASADKTRAFATQLLSHQSGLSDKVDAMPDLTLEDSISRATEWIRGMSKFEFKR